MNVHSSRPASRSPVSGQTDSLVSSSTITDVQESVSSHNTRDHLITVSTPTNECSTRCNINDTHNSEKNLAKNSEYKSNFTPFDQYVYDEIKDSFVRSNNPSSGDTSLIHHSGSNRELAEGATHSPAFDATAFEPPAANGCSGHHGGERSANSPWYNEVIKRNEKASEYRYKSELGHTSPLVKSSTSSEDLTRRSPRVGNDPSVEAQIFDAQQQANSSVHKPNYKRDHLISHMANNNNFNLPKDRAIAAANTAAPRRAQVAASSGSQRTATRSAIHDRARSQSSRRQLVSASINKTQPATKSNQTTPTKSVPTRSATERSTASTRSHHHVSSTSSKQPVGSTTGVAPNRSSNLSAKAHVGSNGDSARSNVINKRPSPLTKPLQTAKPLPSSIERPATARLTSTTTARASATALSRRVTTSSSTTRVAAANKSPMKHATPTTKSPAPIGRSHVTASRSSPVARNTLGSNKSTTGKGASAASPAIAATPTVKSIKTPKALASAEEKATAAALAAAGAATATVVASNSMGESNPLSSSQDDDRAHVESSIEQERQQVADQVIKKEPEMHFEQEHQVSPATQSTDMLYTATEAGVMLADELAQAERVSNTAVEVEQQKLGHQVDLIRQNEWTPNRANVNNNLVGSDSFLENNDKVSEESEILEPLDDTTLVNGLAGGLISADDRFDSSERGGGASSDTLESTNVPPSEPYSQTQHSQNYDDEPYSIMPTYDIEKRENLPIVEPIVTAAATEIESDRFVLGESEAHTGESDEIDGENRPHDMGGSENIGEEDRLEEAESRIEIDLTSKVQDDGELVEKTQLDIESRGPEQLNTAKSLEKINSGTSEQQEDSHGLEKEKLLNVMSGQSIAQLELGIGAKMNEQELNQYLDGTPVIQYLGDNQTALIETDTDKSSFDGNAIACDEPEQEHDTDLESDSQSHQESERQTTRESPSPGQHVEQEPEDDYTKQELEQFSVSKSKRVSFDDSTHEIENVELYGNESDDEQKIEQREITPIPENEHIELESEQPPQAVPDGLEQGRGEQELEVNASAKSTCLIETEPNDSTYETADLDSSDGRHASDEERQMVYSKSVETEEHVDTVPELTQTEPTPEVELLGNTEELEPESASKDEVNQVQVETDVTTTVTNHGEDIDEREEEKTISLTLDEHPLEPKADNQAIPNYSHDGGEDFRSDIQTRDDLSDSNDQSKSELLMNVAELAQFEIKRKEEMAKKSELARQNSLAKSPTSHHFGEVLLSPDQLNEQFLVNLSTEKTDSSDQKERSAKPIEIVSSVSSSTGNVDPLESERNMDPSEATALDSKDTFDHQAILPQASSHRNLDLEILASIDKAVAEESEERLIRDSSDSGAQQAGLLENSAQPSEEKLDFNKHQDSDIETECSPLRLNKNSLKDGLWDIGDQDVKDLKDSEALLLGIGSDTFGQKNVTTQDDDIDGDELLKFSNPLTNSDDELILESRDRTTTSTSNINSNNQDT